MSSECGNTFLPEENGMHPMVFGFSNIKTIQTKSGAKSLGLRLSMTPPLYVDLNQWHCRGSSLLFCEL